MPLQKKVTELSCTVCNFVCKPSAAAAAAATSICTNNSILGWEKGEREIQSGDSGDFE